LKKAFPFILFFIGFLIQLAGLLGEHATEIPFVIRIVAPHYSHALAGIEILGKKHGLEKNDEGYKEISEILIERAFDICRVSPKQIAKSDMRIYRIYDSESLTIQTDDGDVGANFDRPFFYSLVSTNVTFVGGGGVAGGATNFICDIARLQEPIEKLKDSNLLDFCFGMFFLGTIVEFIALFIESKESVEPSENHPNKDEEQSAKPTNEAY
jgi:hypothetical protein